MFWNFHGTSLLKHCLRVCLVSLRKLNYAYLTAHTKVTLNHRTTTEQVQELATIILFSRVSRPPVLCSLCGAKRKHVIKFCEASNTMTRFGRRSSNSCYFNPNRHQKRSHKVCVHTSWNPPFQNPRSATAHCIHKAMVSCDKLLYTTAATAYGTTELTVQKQGSLLCQSVSRSLE